MCGIAGVVDCRRTPQVDERMVRRMTDALRHRGPDGEGYYVRGEVGLGHRRLKVIDLSDRAAQPMISEDGRYVLIFNGEIYNYTRLRAELAQSGRTFRTQSDTEVLLQAFEEWGSGCLPRLIGMFAFAVWDTRDKSLFLARDRVGEKPLVYADVGGRFYFASEIQALRTVREIPADLDLEAIHLFLVYTDIPAPWTAFKHIRKLKPGYFLTVDAKGVNTTQWWKMDFSNKRRRSMQEDTEEFRAIFKEVMADMVQSDVPYGVLLSGGVDSTIVTHELTRLTGKPVGFTVGTQVNGVDGEEMQRARYAAQLLGVDHCCRYFTPAEIESLPAILTHLGSPFLSGTMLLADQLCMLARSRITVAISGNGADEVFGGYSYYGATLRWPTTKKYLGKLAKLTGLTDDNDSGWRGILSAFSKSPQDAIGLTVRRESRFLQHHFEGQRLAEAASNCDPATPLIERWREAEIVEPLDGILYTELMINNHNTYATVPDVVGMRHSLEIRAPFVDARMLSFAASLPVCHKVAYPRRPERNKTVVKEAYADVLPASLLYARKLGFGHGIRFDDLLRYQWYPLMDRLCTNGYCVDWGLIDQTHLTTTLEEHRSGKVNWDRHLYLVLYLEIWIRRCILNQDIDFQYDRV